MAEKLGLGEFADSGPIRLGTAHVDPGRCLPYSKKIPCRVCEEVCPTSPKAIYPERRTRAARDGRKMVVSATASTVTVSARPRAGQVVGEPVHFDISQWKGDGTTRFQIVVRHADGTTESHVVADNDADTLVIEDRFVRQPEAGVALVLEMEFSVPRVDISLCIGCGICERECPVVGDRRAVYITAEGETRSQHQPQRDRNRSVRLLNTPSTAGADASSAP